MKSAVAFGAVEEAGAAELIGVELDPATGFDGFVAAAIRSVSQSIRIQGEETYKLEGHHHQRCACSPCILLDSKRNSDR